MSNLSRRAFLGVSVGGLSALQGGRAALASFQFDPIGVSERLTVDRSSVLNFALFLQNMDDLGLTGVVTMTPVEGDLGSYAGGSLLLFPFNRGASGSNRQAFLPGRGAAGRLIATVPMTPAGLPPDEYFCNHVLKAPPQSFISFSVGAPLVNGAEKRPWYTNVDDIGNRSVGIGWTSSNLNHPWFAGSRWIPDSGQGNGRYWRARIVAGLHQASALMVSAIDSRSVVRS